MCVGSLHRSGLNYWFSCTSYGYPTIDPYARVMGYPSNSRPSGRTKSLKDHYFIRERKMINDDDPTCSLLVGASDMLELREFLAIAVDF